MSSNFMEYIKKRLSSKNGIIQPLLLSLVESYMESYIKFITMKGTTDDCSDKGTTDDCSDNNSEQLIPYNLNSHFVQNWAQLQAYYTMSERQASAAFRCAIFLSILGIALITFAIVSPHVLNLPAEYSLVPVIGSIAGAVVEVFAGTILVVYIKTLSQMSIYHTALADYQRYLSCACLVGNLTEEKRDEMYAEIIREEMKKSTFVEVSAKKNSRFGKKSSD